MDMDNGLQASMDAIDSLGAKILAVRAKIDALDATISARCVKAGIDDIGPGTVICAVRAKIDVLCERIKILRMEIDAGNEEMIAALEEQVVGMGARVDLWIKALAEESLADVLDGWWVELRRGRAAVERVKHNFGRLERQVDFYAGPPAASEVYAVVDGVRITPRDSTYFHDVRR